MSLANMIEVRPDRKWDGAELASDRTCYRMSDQVLEQEQWLRGSQINWNLSLFISVFDSKPEIWLFTSELLKSEAEKVGEFFYTDCISGPQIVFDMFTH